MLSNRFIRTLALLLAFVLVAPMISANEGDCAVEGECADPNAVVIDPNCPDRDHVVRCAGKYLDKNQNGLLERFELQGAIDELPWYVFHYSKHDFPSWKLENLEYADLRVVKIFRVSVMLYVLHFRFWLLPHLFFQKN
jgi:hypothetical protein